MSPKITKLPAAFCLYFTLAFASCYHKTDKDQDHVYMDLQEALKNPDRVYRINLIAQNLSQFPPELKSFPNLTNLDLYQNRIRAIPSWISEIKNLKNLDLSFNLIDTLPTALFQLSKLTKLDLKYNHLNNLSLGFGKLANLRDLDLSSNALDRLPDDFGELKKLTFLAIEKDGFKEAPKVIFSIKSLQTLHLYSNDISNISDSIAALTNLTELSGDANRLSSKQIEHLRAILPNCSVYFAHQEKSLLSEPHAPEKALKSSDLLGTWKNKDGGDSMVLNFKATGIALVTLDEQKNKRNTFALVELEHQNILKMRPLDKDSTMMEFYKISKLSRDCLNLIYYQTNSLDIGTKKWREMLFSRPVEFTLVKSKN